jgi:hypothetical protein
MLASVNSSLQLQQPGRAIGRGEQTVQSALVTGNSDFVGLLAMAIYDQHRSDWEQNYKHTFGHAPDDHARQLYDIGENTPRRLACYRQLAEARLAGTVSPAPVGPSESFLARLYRVDRRKRARSPVWKRLAGLSD